MAPCRTGRCRMGVWYALGSATCYGVADFAGGMLSRRANGIAIAIAGQLGGLVLTVVAALLVPAPDIASGDLVWGAASGVGTGVGMAFLYRGLSHGAMSVVVPVSAVGGLALPVAANVAVLGDRPSVASWLGLVAAVPALWCVSMTRTDGAATSAGGVGDGLVASLGIALQYLALAQAGAVSGLWPLAAGPRSPCSSTSSPPATRWSRSRWRCRTSTPPCRRCSGSSCSVNGSPGGRPAGSFWPASP